jgi:hypothetical protein
MSQAMDRSGRGLVPYEVMEIVSQVLEEKRFTSECNAAYLATVRDFISKNVARKLAHERRERGMFDALERNAEFDDETDLSMGVSGEISQLCGLSLLSYIPQMLIGRLSTTRRRSQRRSCVLFCKCAGSSM